MIVVLAAAPTLASPAARRAPTARDLAFADFIASLWPMAETLGVSRKTFDRAFEGVAFDPRVVAKPAPGRVHDSDLGLYRGRGLGRPDRPRPRQGAGGRALARQGGHDLRRRLRRFSWGSGAWRSDFGASPGTFDVVRSLASLAFVRFRDEYFRDELLSALAILEEGDIAPRAMIGSWAGAMGQTQFMPSSFLAYAVDFTARAGATSGRARRTPSARPPTSWPPTAGRATSPGVSRSPCRPVSRSQTPISRAGALLRPSPRAASSEPTESRFGRGEGRLLHAGRAQGADLPRHRQLRRHQGLQFLDRLRARASPCSAIPSWAVAGSRRALATERTARSALRKCAIFRPG